MKTRISFTKLKTYFILIPFIYPRGFSEYFPIYKRIMTIWLYASLFAIILDFVKKTKINIVENIYKYVEESPNIKILKITVCDSDKIIFSGIVRKIKTISKVNVLDISHMSRKIIKHGTEDVKVEYYYTEVSNENVDKWTAIKFLTNKLEIDENEVVAIGDNANDKQMVMNAGLGIAMGNSMLDIQKIGDYKVADNNSDGVAEAINKYILS